MLYIVGPVKPLETVTVIKGHRPHARNSTFSGFGSKMAAMANIGPSDRKRTCPDNNLADLAHPPPQVQEIGQSLFLQRDVPSELRMQMLAILFQTKPSLALVSMLTSHLLEETDLQVASFAYTYMKNIARSTSPDNHYL